MYMLVDEPTGSGPTKQAFDAIDDAFGTDEFSEGQATTAIMNSLGCEASEAGNLFDQLRRNDCISEV